MFAFKGVMQTNITNVVPNYADSYESRAQLTNFMSIVNEAYLPPSEQTIQSIINEYVSGWKSKWEMEVASLMEWTSDTSDIGTLISQMLQERNGSGEAGAAEATSEQDKLSKFKLQSLEEINQKYQELITNAESYVRQEKQQSAERSMQKVENNPDFLYVVQKDGEVVATNIKGEHPFETIISASAGSIEHYSSEGEFLSEASVQSDMEAITNQYSDGWLLGIAMKEQVFEQKAEAYSIQYDRFKTYLVTAVLCLAASIFCFIWLMYTAGKAPDREEAKLAAVDKLVYLDIGFILMILSSIVFFVLAYIGFWSMDGPFYKPPTLDWLGAMGVCGSIAGGISAVLLWTTSLSRRIKCGNAREFTLVHALSVRFAVWDDRIPLKAKIVWTFVLYILAGIVSMAFLLGGWFFESGIGVFLGIVFLALYVIFSLYYFMKKGTQLKSIEFGVEQIKEGNLDYKIMLEDRAEFGKIAQNINNIAEGLLLAVGKEVKSERMKTELITNISHDIKTPLTSILTYVDLLKNETDLSSEAARKYIEVLEAKSHRLKVLTDDLFEAAKAASGDMAVELVRIELVQFMEQALGEWSDKIEQAEVSFEIELPKPPIYIHADGRMLFRVLGNVFDNAIKYAFAGSRVYVDVLVGDEEVCVVVKNVSKDKLNITEEELMERFVRGDSSRNTEGSGLGLSIAQNLMKLMNGEFVIEIDGDLFKAKICMPRAQELPEDEANSLLPESESQSDQTE